MAELWMRFPGGLTKTLTLSYDDGLEQDARLLELMQQHGLKGAFNLNSGCFAPEGTVHPAGQPYRRMTKQAAVELLANAGQEIAIHANFHGDLPGLPPAHAVWQVVKDKEALENHFQRIIRGMAYPYGTYSPELFAALRSCGVAYARTVEATHLFDLPNDWLALPPTCRHRDPELMNLLRQFVDSKPYRPQMFFLWGHSYEFEADQNWPRMESFAACAGHRDDIWYATPIEICDYVNAWKRMHISADGRRLYNPSAITLWLSHSGKIHTLSSGEELCV